MSNSQTLKDKGNQCFATGDFINAIKHYTQAIAIDSNNHILYSNRSAAYLQANDFQNALADANKCTQIDPSFSKGTLRLADAQLQLLQFDAALASYTTCLSASDKSVSKLAAVGLQNIKIKRFYAPRVTGLGVEPKYIGETRGKGLFATKNYKTGDIIFQEDSILLTLDPECPRDVTCDHCMRFVESADAQVTRCKLQLTGEQIVGLKKVTTPLLPCPSCQTSFCSDTCYNTASQLYHSKLCVPTSSSDHPLNVYKNLPMVKSGPTSTIFMMVARILACIATTLSKIHQSNPTTQEFDFDALFGSLHLFQRESLMKLQPSYNGSNLTLLQSNLTQPLQLLKDALFSGYPTLQDFIDKTITENLFDEILGMVSTNNTTAYVLPSIFHHLNIRQSEVANARAHGICLFALHSCINHSCAPSIRLLNTDHVMNAKVVMRAIKPIKQGEELLITYIDETQTKAERQQELISKYGFTCTCSRC